MTEVGRKKQSSIIRTGEICLGNPRGCHIKSWDFRVKCVSQVEGKGRNYIFIPLTFCAFLDNFNERSNHVANFILCI